MILYTVIAIVSITLACMVKTTSYSGRLDRQRLLNMTCIAAIFVILTLLASLRIEVGNDYGTYVVTCHEIFQGGYVVTELGYNLVVRALYTLSGSENYLLMFAVFGAAITWLFIKSMYDLSDCFALSFSLFILLGVYFRSFNTVRYYFALALALYSLRYVVNITTHNKKVVNANDVKISIDIQNLLKFIVLILIAATFHKSVLVVIPLYLIARLPWKKWTYVVIIVAGGVIYLLQDKVMELALILYPSYKDTVYIEQTHSLFENAPIIFRCALVIILCAVFSKDALTNRADNKMYLNMSIMATILYLCCSWLPLITRFGYYLITAQIILVPNVIVSIKSDRKRSLALRLVIAIAILYFIYFLKTATAEGIRVLPYKSWLFYDHYWLNQTDTF